MASCRGCGSELPQEAAFCPSCGVAVDDAVALVGADQSLTDQSTVSRDDRPRSALVAAGVASIVVLAWLLFISGDGEPASEAASTIPATTARPDTSPPTTDDAPVTTSDAAEKEQEQQEEQEENVSGAGEPLLGQEVGLSLLVSSTGRVHVIDLDRATTRDVELRGEIVLVEGDRLIIDGFEQLYSVALDDLDGETVELGLGYQGSRGGVVARAEEPGQIWDVDYTEDGLSWRRVDVVSGAELEVRKEGDWYGGLPSAPDLVSSRSGGVWLVEGDGYRHVSSGDLVGANEELALIVSCQAPDDCWWQWYDRQTWKPAPLRVPDVADDLYAAWVLGSRLLAYPTESGFALFDIHTGDHLFDGQLDHRLWQGPSGPALSLSADERYVAVGSVDGSPMILDLVSGESWELSPLPGRFSSAVFVETELLGGGAGAPDPGPSDVTP